MKRLLALLALIALTLAPLSGSVVLINSYQFAAAGDVTAPTVSSVTVGSDGVTVTIVFSEAVTRGAGWNNGDLDIDGATANNVFTYVSGDGTSTWTGTLGTAAVNAETLNFDFNGDANSIEDGAGNDLASVTNGSVTNNTASSYLLSDDMEYADATAAALGGWNNHGSPGWGYATSPAPLDGTKSLSLVSNANYVDHDFTASPEVGLFVHINTSSLTNDYVVLRDASGNNLAYFLFTSTGKIQIFDGSGGAETATSTVAGATGYYVWLHRVKGTGADGVLELYHSTTAIRPGSPTLSISNGTTTADAANVQLYNDGGGTFMIDYLRVSASAIGSSPP